MQKMFAVFLFPLAWSVPHSQWVCFLLALSPFFLLTIMLGGFGWFFFCEYAYYIIISFKKCIFLIIDWLSIHII